MTQFNEKIISSIILIAVLVGGAAFTSGYLYGRHNGVKEASSKKSTLKEDDTQTASDTSRLRVCINDATDREAQTSCFRKAEKGMLPAPSLEQLDALPDLY